MNLTISQSNLYNFYCRHKTTIHWLFYISLAVILVCLISNDVCAIEADKLHADFKDEAVKTDSLLYTIGRWVLVATFLMGIAVAGYNQSVMSGIVTIVLGLVGYVAFTKMKVAYAIVTLLL